MEAFQQPQTSKMYNISLILFSEFFDFVCRWDIVVNATENIGNYWIYFRGLTDCSQQKTQSVAILRYDGAPVSAPTTTPNTYDERPTNLTVSIGNCVIECAYQQMILSSNLFVFV